MKKTPRLIIRQNAMCVFILITLPLLFSFIPTRSFGQATQGSIGNDAFSSLDSLPPPPTTAVPAPATFAPSESETPTPMETPATPNAEEFFAQQPALASSVSAAPSATTATAKPLTANQYSSASQQQYRPAKQQQGVPQRDLAQHELLPRDLARREDAFNGEHPFRQYWGMPNDPQTKITGKPITVAELITDTRSSVVRCQLLHAYWELSGLLALYHFRCETEKLATGLNGAQQDGMVTMLREQCRTAELEFIKQQWALAELLRQCKGWMLREPELPIPADVPLYPRYQTHADKIALTERTQYLGRMIPIQEQLIESKNGTWKAAWGMTQSGAQPMFALLSQRTLAFLDLTQAIIEYNKMIAEYATETIPPNAGQHQLVRAVVRMPGGKQSQVSPTATSGITLTHYDAPAAVTAEPIGQVAYEYQIPTSDALDTTEAQLGGIQGTMKDRKEPLVPDVMLDF